MIVQVSIGGKRMRLKLTNERVMRRWVVVLT